MSNKIERYLKGDFDYEGGSLIFSCAKIEITIPAKQDFTGDFFIEEQSGKEFYGRVYSSHLTMECLTPEFSGTGITISYKTNIQDRACGDVLKGEFYIISSMGEYVIPYVINISYENIDSSLGPIKNLFHFTNLAKCNWSEAVSLFAGNDFINILTGNDRKYLSLYRGLKNSQNNNHKLDEFLVGIHKKQPLEYSLDRGSIRLVNPEPGVPLQVRINRSGWGFVSLKAERRGDFLDLNCQLLQEEDFDGNTCEYVFFVNEEELHEGNNFGQLIFTHHYGKLVVDVNVVRLTTERQGQQQKKKALYRITRTYLDFRLKRLSLAKCISQIKESLSYIKNLSAFGSESVLVEAHLMITQEKFNEAKWLLDHGIGDPEELEDANYCYYLYLTALYSADEYYGLQVVERVRSIYSKNESDWRIAWIYMHLSPEMNKSPMSKWSFGMEQIKRGCASPIFYIEVLRVLNHNPSLLNQMGDEQLRLLYFGAKNQFLSQELCNQIVAVALRVKQYNKLLFQILRLIYEKKGDDATLQAICILLMKGDREETNVHDWYAKGVERGLPITRLYEYFMLSVDTRTEEKLPKSVLMYFSYECSLPVKYAAYIYAYIHKNMSSFGELYELYRPQIARFLVKQLYAKKMDSNLAYLYQEILVKEMLTPDNAQQFASLMFVNCITVERERIVSVVILDERLNHEMVYPVVSQRAYVMLFGSEYTVLLEDEEGRRFVGNQEYQIECFFLPRRFVPVLSPWTPESIPFALFICGGFQDNFFITGENVSHFQYLEQAEDLTLEYRMNIRMSLLNYYFEKDDTQAQSELLQRMDTKAVPPKHRADFVRLLSVHGYFENVYDLILKFGAENIDPKTIVRVCTYMVEQKQNVYDEKLMRIIYSAFVRGKYNDIVLTYLVNYYTGSAKILRNIWKAAMNFDIDTYKVCENILKQLIETGVFIGEEEEIYTRYISYAPGPEVDLAYLSWICFEYMVFDRVCRQYVFDNLERLYQQEKSLPDVCMLAYLQYYSEKTEQQSREQKKMCREFIRQLYRGKKMIMPFFAAYKDISPDADSLAHSCIISYKGNPKSLVVLHYMVNRDDEEQSGYIKEPMENMFGGIFVKEFVLFFGESLQYYITEEYANKEQLTKSGTLQNSDTMEEEHTSRFTMVNDIAIATTLKDYSTSKELIEEYARQEYMVESLFSLQ